MSFDGCKTKTATITLCGAPNVGKSTLLNRILNCKLAICSSKPQTTRFNIKGVLTRDDTQLVFIDTPGIFRPKLSQLEKQIVKEAWQSFCGADLACLIIDASKGVDGSAKKIIEKITNNSNLKLLAVVNKSDLVTMNEKVLLASELNKFNCFDEIFFISAKKGNGCDVLIEYFFKNADYGEWEFNEDALTDKNSEFIASEFVREQLFKILSKELPYMLSCETEIFEEKEDEIFCSVIVKIGKENHKKMILGAGGSNLKKIVRNASVNLEKLLGKKVKLKVFIKLEKKK